MSCPSSQKQMTPFQPHPFPPRHRHKKTISALLRKANRSLQEYSALLDQSSSFQPLFSQIINLEAIASVESQKVKTTLENFLRFIQAKNRRKNSKLTLVLNDKEALLWACENIHKSPISKKMLCTIHKKIKQNSVFKADLGAYRNRQNWIGPEGCKIEEAYFYPPATAEVKSLMKELLSYVKVNEKEPLLQLAFIFAQLLIIHPFMDGNGRLARILIPLFLYQKAVIPIPCLSMSRYFLRHRLEYFQNLFKITESNRWESWILFFFKGIIAETTSGCQLIKQIIALYNQMKQNFPTLKKETLIFLFQNLIFSSSSFEKSKGDAYLLDRLKRSKLIKREAKGTYCFSALQKILKNKRFE
jgi:Fic family protein